MHRLITLAAIWAALIISSEGRVNACAESCGPGRPPAPAPVVPRGPRTVVTPQGQPAFTVDLVGAPSAGPAVRLALAYAPGFDTEWTGPGGEALIASGWNWTLPCLSAGAGADGIPQSVVWIDGGITRVTFTADATAGRYLAPGAPDVVLTRTGEDVFVLRDRFGGAITFAGFTGAWPEPQRGKPLVQENPYFRGDRAVRFNWSVEGLLEDIIDTAGRRWRFAYDRGRAVSAAVISAHFQVLYRVEFLYAQAGVPSGAPDGQLAAVSMTIAGHPSVWASHVFRYHADGPQQDLLAHVIDPAAVAELGGLDAALACDKDTAAVHARQSLRYARQNTGPAVVVAAFRGSGCGACGDTWHRLSYEHNDDASGVQAWAVRVVQEEPSGSTLCADYNVHAALLNWARTDASKGSAGAEHLAFVYDDAGRTVRVIQTGPPSVDDVKDHPGAPGGDGAGHGMVHELDYDDRGRVIRESMAPAGALEDDGADRVTVREYEYRDGLPWPSVVREWPGAAPVDTRFFYTFEGPEEELVLAALIEELPAVSPATNGSGRPARRCHVFDPSSGRRIRMTDALGVVTEYAYDALTGLLLRRTEDATGLALTTTWRFDAWGNRIRVAHPDGRVENTFTACLSWGRRLSVTHSRDGGPARLTVSDLAGRTLAEAIGVAHGGIAPEDAIDVLGDDLPGAWRGVLADRTEYAYANGQLRAVARVGSGDGGEDVRHETRYQYDAAGRLWRTIAPEGTVLENAYDVFGRITGLREGLEGGPLTLRERRTHDSKGRLLTVRRYAADPGPDADHTGELTAYAYDWRGRLVTETAPGEDGAAGVARRYFHDHLGRVVETHVRPAGNAAYRIERHVSYDARGQVWRERVYDLEHSERFVETRHWYDAAGRRVKTLFPQGGSRKDAYDALGRRTAVHIGFDPAEALHGVAESYDDAVTPDGLRDDVVLESEHYQYDAGGRETLCTHMTRAQDARGVGALVPGAACRVRQGAVWYDGAGRIVVMAVRGAEDDPWAERPAVPPARGGGIIRTDCAYDAFGRLADVLRPDDVRVSYGYDSLSRRVREQEGDVTIALAYDGADRVVARQVAFLGDEEPSVRATVYVYGVSRGGACPSHMATGRFLAEVRHPDPITGEAGARPQDIERWAYDAQGRITRHEKPAAADGTRCVRVFTHDTAGRIRIDSAVEIGSGTDATVRSVAYDYDAWGRRARVASHELPHAGGGVLNETVWEYNGFGQLVREAQEHDGACTAATPAVAYVWSGAEGDGLSRLLRMVYPSHGAHAGMVLEYGYGRRDAPAADGADWVFGRAGAITAPALGDGALAVYRYEGIDTVVARRTDSAWPGFALTRHHVHDALGRVREVRADLEFMQHPLASIDRFRYDYDGAGRITVERDAAGQDRVRSYDALGGLAAAAEGRMGSAGLYGATRRAAWDLSGSGNWRSTMEEGKVTRREHDHRDRITAIDGRASFAYDGSGNTQAADDAIYVYDAWGRLTAYAAGRTACTMARDGLGRVIRETVFDGGLPLVRRDLYYAHPWQAVSVVERRGEAIAVEEYAWGVEHEDAPLWMRRREGSRAETRIFVQDALRNVTGVCNAFGLPIERYRYDPHGRVTVRDAQGRPTAGGAPGSRVLFHGRRLHGDPSAELYDFRFRAYVPALGRFLQPDPLGLHFRHNLYAAPFGSSWLDPLGLKPELRNCSGVDLPLVSGRIGAGFVLGGHLAVKSQVCDCCNDNNVWVIDGWEETSVEGGVSLGVGLGVSVSVWGLDIGAMIQVANVRLLDCSLSLVTDLCNHQHVMCGRCGGGVKVGFPLVTLGGVIASLSGSGSIFVDAEYEICHSNQGLQQFVRLCYGWEAWGRLKLFWLQKVFSFGGARTCFEKEF